MHEAITALMLADPAITAHVGPRVHWLMLPVGVTARPYVILQQIGQEESYHSKGRAGLFRARLQVDCWADVFDDALAVGRACEDLLSGYRGAVAGVDLQGVFSEDARDLTDRGLQDEARLFRRSQDFMVHWRKD